MRIVIVLLILGGLLVAADFGFAAVAEHRVSQQAREQFELKDDPAVTVHGFPFTTQALSGSYDHITVSAEAVQVGDTLRELGLTAELRDVTAPLSDLLDGNTEAIIIGDLEVIATIRQADVGRLVKFPDLKIDPAAEEFVRSGDEEDEVDLEDLNEEVEQMDTFPPTAGVKLTATTDIAGEQDVELAVFALIELDGPHVRISPERLDLTRGGSTMRVPDEVRRNIMPQFAITIEPGDLPFDVTPTGIAVEGGALQVQGKATDVTFAKGVQD